jgi:hypothetical protein
MSGQADEDCWGTDAAPRRAARGLGRLLPTRRRGASPMGLGIQDEHRYIGSEKQEPIITQGSVNDAMHAAEVKIRGGWSDIVRSWENT